MTQVAEPSTSLRGRGARTHEPKAVRQAQALRYGLAVEQDRITTPDRRPEDLDAALRPKTLDEFVGQAAARENLRIFIDAAKGRGDALDHVLFFGPPGL